MSSQIHYLPLCNYFIKYPHPLKIYVTICNEIVDPLPLWPLPNFWMVPYDFNHKFSITRISRSFKTLSNQNPTSFQTDTYDNTPFSSGHNVYSLHIRYSNLGDQLHQVVLTLKSHLMEIKRIYIRERVPPRHIEAYSIKPKYF